MVVLYGKFRPNSNFELSWGQIEQLDEYYATIYNIQTVIKQFINELFSNSNNPDHMQTSSGIERLLILFAILDHD